MLNFEVSPETLAPYVPAGTELDLYEGKAYASVVGFLFLDTKILGLSIPFHQNFEELNLRFYVKRCEGGHLKRGVVFVQELVPKPAIAWTAQLLYGENYRAARMSHQLGQRGQGPSASIRFECRWRWRRMLSKVLVETRGVPYALKPGSFNEFIAEHYWGYAKRRGNRTVEYQVLHPSWLIRDAARWELDIDVASQYGPQFVEALRKPPRSVFLAEGSEVAIAHGRRL